MEFDRQVQTLLDKNYPELSGLTQAEFLTLVEPLRSFVPPLHQATDLESGTIPYVIVVLDSLISSEQKMAAVTKDGVNGVTILRPHTSKNFKNISDIDVPDKGVYLLVDIDRGKSSLNKPPADALVEINAAQRSPLTIDEGIALVTHYPEFLKKNNCFSLLGSRTGADKRVPALWINGKHQPNLGWCWDGNPHTWLGSASCGQRLG